MGTTVTIYLPRSAEAARTEPARPPAEDTVPAGRGETILVVGDDPDVRSLAVRVLTGLGYRVHDFGTGEDAMAHLDRMPPIDLLFTDVILPGAMAGPMLAEEMARRSPGTKVLHMSGYAENALVHEGRLKADVKLLRKPFRRRELGVAVREALEGG